MWDADTDTDADLRAAIWADPTDIDLRHVWADSLVGIDEADLVSVLLGPPGPHSMNLIQQWFETRINQFSPAHFGDDAGDGDAIGADPGASPPPHFFLVWATRRERWADWDAWELAVIGIARRLLANARAHLPPEHQNRQTLEVIAARGEGAARDAPPSPEWLVQAHRVVWVARQIAGHVYGSPFESWSESSAADLPEQFHVLGWAWLNLPPIRPEAEVWPPRDEEPARRPWWRRLLGQ